MLSPEIKYFYLIVAVLLLFGCKQETPAPLLAMNTTPDYEAPSMLYISAFTEFPPEIQSCSCKFATDSLDMSEHKFIYVNDTAQTSFLKVNGVLTKFAEVSHLEVDSLTTTATYKSNNYEMHIEVKKRKTINSDKTSVKTGTIKLSDDTGKTLEKTFYGECGC